MTSTTTGHTAAPSPTWTLDLFIDGKPEPGRDTPVTVFDPATELELAAVPQADVEQVDRAVLAARRAFDSGAWTGLGARGRARLMHRLADELERRSEELAAAITYECGTPIAQSRVGQVKMPLDILRSYADLAAVDRTEPLGVDLGPMPSDSLVNYQPVGVVAVIPAYNYPLVLALRTMGGALAAGCTVVIAPSPRAPLATLMLAESIAAADFPPGVVNIVLGGPSVGRRLTSHPEIDKIGFTGSRQVGEQIMRQAAPSLKGVTLELGGKTPTVVLPGVELAPLVRRMHLKYLMNAGQACAAPSRLLVHRDQHDEFVELSAAAYTKIRTGDPWHPKTIVGPLIGLEHRQRVEEMVDAAVRDGAVVAAGGGRPEIEKGWFMNPVLLDNVAPTAPIAQDEIFGPVGVLLTYEDIDDAVALANDVPYGLAADVFSATTAEGIGVAKRLRAGTVYVNGGGGFRLDAPFGGFKASGIGREYGEWGVREFLEPQHIQWSLR
ncbi:aldehyde dehydrogenase family protein [Streptomyces sp. NEAU-YJ-81]|uniref:aldehyde dehydrogenase family protein n=1 Tax=Streptomyces sp. NEAU-YJ-81 TaxID=2820288 RepID=UPI001ABCDC26|nr:aldehyde dehydrogenase family protein [Streptomyces sp. NEAU-YJ-81]MBO3682248.1 aldehyde dehydrogenase family protein [Streptomyces sp. NEAU-YJ-81]